MDRKINLDQELLEFFELLEKLRGVLSKQMKKEYKRSLPFSELVFDRWARAKELGFGERSSIYDSSYVFGKVIVGKDTWIGPFTILDGGGRLTIGDHCSISAGVQIYTHDSVGWAINDEELDFEPTEIGNNCYIGPNAIITKGVKLGDRCIVGANSFVNKSFPAGSKIIGSPARLILPDEIIPEFPIYGL